MSNWLAAVGEWGLRALKRTGRACFLLYYCVLALPSVIRRPRELLRQIHSVGGRSLLIILISGLFAGMVLSLQGYNTLVGFGATQSLGTLVALSLVRELGPVISALLYGGRAGSALTAEIGLMAATEQLAGMEMMALDPIEVVILPRLLAGIISMPLLAAIFSAVGILGGYLVAVGLLGLDEGAFWSQMQSKVDLYDDIANGLLKSAVFGFAATWIALFQGYDAVPTAEGVSRATTRTVVHTALAVLILDFMLTALMFNTGWAS